MKDSDSPTAPLPASAEGGMNAPAAPIDVTCFVSADELETEILRLRNLEAGLGRPVTAAEITSDPLS